MHYRVGKKYYVVTLVTPNVFMEYFLHIHATFDNGISTYEKRQ